MYDMKQGIALLLCVAMLLPLLAGCGAPAEETQTTEALTEISAEPTAEPTTEPTVDPEELFLRSLPADVRRAYEAGLVDREALNDLERKVTVGEAAELLNKAQLHRTGAESRTLADLQKHGSFASRNADRGWLMGIPALLDLEQAYPDRYTDYEQWTQEVLKIQYASLELHFSFAARLGMSVYMTGERTLYDKKSAWDMTYSEDGNEYLLSAYDVIITNASDYAEFAKAADGLYVTDSQMLSYGLVLHDGTTGKKFMEMDAGQFNPFRELTFGEVVESALRLYNAPNPVEYPEFVTAEEVGKYNEAIITPELLSKETDLPEASCAKLPSEWHGVVMNDLQVTNIDTTHQDARIYEYEIQAVKDAGFNYIGLYLDFSWLQDYILFESGRVAFYGMLDQQDMGKVSVERLEQLDQILAWCMERDIHVNLRACTLPNINQDTKMGMHWQLDFNGKTHAPQLAAMWQVIARRYAEIPNEYLSFTLFSYDCAAEASTLLPSVDAIREESPDRCIIAEMNSYKFKADTFAQKGVALSGRIWDYEDMLPVFDHNHEHCIQGSPYGNTWKTECLESIRNFSWPYEGHIDAATLFATRHWTKTPSMTDIAEAAQTYGVGYMLSDFGVRFYENGTLDSLSIPRERYPMAEYLTMLQDITTTAEQMGCGWCFTYWYGPWGVTFGMPLFEDTTYVQVEDYPYYIDETMFGFFQGLNGIGEGNQSVPDASQKVIESIFPGSTILTLENTRKIAEYETMADERRNAILTSETRIVKSDTFVRGETYTGTAYYVSSDGKDSNDGKTPETAWKTPQRVTQAHESNELKYGDAVFFRRGDTFWVDPNFGMMLHEGVTYSAYGTGDKPVLTLSEGNAANTQYWKLYYDKDGIKIWKYHKDLTAVGGIVFNDSSWAEKIQEWPTNGKWQRLVLEKLPAGSIAETVTRITDPTRTLKITGTGEFPAVEENMPRNLSYIHRPDISKAVYPIDFAKNPQTNMPYTGPLYLRCDEGNPGEVFRDIQVLGCSAPRANGRFYLLNGFYIDDYVVDNLSLKYYIDHAVGSTLQSKGAVVQNCEIAFGGARYHQVQSATVSPEYFCSGDSLYGVGNGATIRNNYAHDAANLCLVESGPLGQPDNMGTYVCEGNLVEHCGQGIRNYLHASGTNSGPIPYDKIVIRDNMVMDTGTGMNDAYGEIKAAIDLSGGIWQYAKEIRVENNICVRSVGVMVRRTDPMFSNEFYSGNVFVHDPSLPLAVLMNDQVRWIQMPKEDMIHDGTAVEQTTKPTSQTKTEVETNTAAASMTLGRTFLDMYNDPSREGAAFLEEIRPFNGYVEQGVLSATAQAVLAGERAYQSLTVNSVIVDGTPLYEVFKDDGTEKPLAFLLAGGDSSKDECLQNACELALAGIYAVCIDSAGCGDSLKGPLDALPSFAETVFQIDSVVEYYNTIDGVNASRFGIRGGSKGGNIAFAYVGHGLYRPAVIAATSATPDYSCLGDGPLYDCFDYGKGGQPRVMTDAETAEFVQRYSPINWPERFLDVVVIAANGLKDEITDAAGCMALEKKLEALGGKKYSFHYFDGYGHEGLPFDDNSRFMECLLNNQ